MPKVFHFFRHRGRKFFLFSSPVLVRAGTPFAPALILKGGIVNLHRSSLVFALCVAASAGFAPGGGDMKRHKDDKKHEDEKKKDAPKAGGAGVAGLSSTAPAPCEITQRVQPLAGVLAEASGAAQGRRRPELFWTHGDSGASEVFAIDAAGKIAGRVRVDGARVGDWEDIAAARCSAGQCLYIADIGDNHAARKSVTVYRVPEPDAREAATKPAETFQARYPEGPNDAEALFVLAPDQVYVVTKGSTGPIALYRFPMSASGGQAPAMQKVRELASAKVGRDETVTGASASPDGRWVAIRSRGAVAFFRAPDLLGSGGPAFAMDLKQLGEPQGEGLSLGPDGAVILTSEAGRKSPTVARLSCKLP
jgi:hypothetical protein